LENQYPTPPGHGFIDHPPQQNKLMMPARQSSDK